MKPLAAKSTPAPNRRPKAGQAAVWQARLIMLVMINIAQLWILAATVDAALARQYSFLIPLVVASGVCFIITLSIIKWWRPTSRKKTSTAMCARIDEAGLCPKSETGLLFSVHLCFSVVNYCLRKKPQRHRGCDEESAAELTNG